MDVKMMMIKVGFVPNKRYLFIKHFHRAAQKQSTCFSGF